MGKTLIKLFLILLTTLFAAESFAGPFSDFKAGAELSEELSSSPTGKRNTPSSDSLVQSQEALNPDNSSIWYDLQNNLLGKDVNVLFVDDIKLIMQDYIEEAHKVPLIVTLPKRLHNFKNFILIIENNPIQQAMSIKPYRSIEALGMNIRLEDDSPVRAAVLGDNGIWYLSLIHI